jgi:hypothetical protein
LIPVLELEILGKVIKERICQRQNHINGLEGFFGYLKRQLASRGGIRRERLPFYLAEYV